MTKSGNSKKYGTLPIYVIGLIQWLLCYFPGLDNSICTYGGLLSYRKHPSTIIEVAKNVAILKNGATQNFMESIAVPKNLRILLINTKVKYI